MTEKTTKDTNLAFALFKELEADNFGYIYRGLLTQKLTVDILGLAETSLDKYSDPTSVKKKVYFIMMEGLQNITRHQDMEQDELSEKSGVFFFQKKKDKYYITTGNIIEREKEEGLASQIEMINSLSKEQLKKYYKETLLTGRISDKGGAGLGLIEMARKSGRKLKYNFHQIDEVFSFFYFHIEIPYTQLPEEVIAGQPEAFFSIQSIKNLHKILNKENIHMSFHGMFNQDNLYNLLLIFEEQMGKSKLPTRKKVFNLMVEMLQNLVKHGDNPGQQGSENSPGIFFLSSKNNKFTLTAGNYVRTDKVDNLKQHIDFANKLTSKEANKYYNKVLADFSIDKPDSPGLGIIDIKLKSNNFMEYDFVDINEDYKFFSFQVQV